MARHATTTATDEQIAALATSLSEVLRVQSSEKSVLPTSLIGSPQLSLVQFTLICQSSVGNGHVIIHVDGMSASASPPGQPEDPSDLSASTLEAVHLSLISDKFPAECIPPTDAAKDAMFLIKFWADLSFKEGSAEHPDLFHVTTMFENSNLLSISCKTSVCSFGRSIGDKIEKLQAVQLAPDRVAYQSVKAPLCDYLINFIQKLRNCGDVATMNGVLENFSVIQVVFNDVTQETLLSFVYIFEVCPPELSATTGAMCKVYRLDASNSGF